MAWFFCGFMSIGVSSGDEASGGSCGSLSLPGSLANFSAGWILW